MSKIICTDKRKELYWDICKHIKKDTIMICTLNNKPCPEWDEYRNGDI